MSEQTFLDKLTELRISSCDEIPTPQMAILARATARLRRSGLLNKCLRLGETVPDFKFIDGDNNPRTLYELLATGPAVLNFFRGFWCPFCKTELEALGAIQAELAQAGCHYLAITPQVNEKRQSSEGFYQIVYDKQNQIASQFNIVYTLSEEEKSLLKSWGIELSRQAEDVNWTLPIPATYLIAGNRTVAFQFTDADFRSRCCPETLVAELRRLLAS